MKTADRQHCIIELMMQRSGFVKVQELRDRFAASDSTIRADMDYLRERFAIDSRSGRYGGYQLLDVPVYMKHANMLYSLQQNIEQNGGVKGYDPILMDEAIIALESIKKNR